ncbi:MAG: universal stress protein UspA [Desulfobulbaceae bacterium BRH_c16a]|nr:MAG: universal stress protein UspA [Desulfobulbaceae bacterium BRH_c16a]
MKILVCYRGSDVGKDLIHLAAQHAKAFAADVQLVTSFPGGEKTTTQQVIEAEEALEKAKKILTDQGIATESHLLVRGKTAGEDIITFARENACSEIIIGVKSRSKVGKILFGSTAQYVILKSDCPVVSVR